MRRTASLLVAIAACVAGLGVAYARRHAGKAPPPRPAVSGVAAVVERFECYRCHDAPGKLVPAVRVRHCVDCHQVVLAGGLDDDYPLVATAGWKRHIRQLTAVPSLTAIDARLRRDWLVAFLQTPHDLRPALAASMPRLPIGPEDAEAIAEHFIPRASVAAPTPEPVALGEPERGRAIFLDRACHDCHRFEGADLPTRIREDARPEVRLSPDLRHTRDRMTPTALLAWLADPVAMKPDTLMPPAALTPEERLDVAAFILEADLTPPAPPPATLPQRLPLLASAVSWDAVERRVFRHVCWHCHSDPEPVGGDGGPGNTGGFGFAGAGLDLGTHAAVIAGARRREDGATDVLAADASGTPRIVTAMLARHVEAAGGQVPGVRGMPLGLEPLSLEQIQLVESWIAQGAPGPTD